MVKILEYLEQFKGKNILITGGTGSFGKYVTKALLSYEPAEIRIFSRGEDRQRQMKLKFPQRAMKFIIGDVRDYERVLEATKGMDVVFHAAALKQVPLIERHPYEAVKTNIYGTLNVKRACIENKVEKCLLISTDKAVKAVNAYGMTKALAEKSFLCNEFTYNTKFSCVRYGNVIGSTGSVVPVFKKLIEEGKPLTITDPKMTRFLITLKQAIELVFFAIRDMEGGEIFVPKIPSCKITDLAVALGGPEYPLKFVGIRPGEKIHECLIQEDEMRRTVSMEKYFKILPYEKDFYQTSSEESEFTSENTRRLNVDEIKDLLKSD